MVAILHHRGPDAEGALLDGPLAMGMRRLSIIDLATGDQPVFNEDGRLAVVFNGEIYNYLELRRTLRDHGHRFRTTGDTEVLVHAFEQWGASFTERLNGMFAFALWDRTRSELILARDRMGVKPLYYAQCGGRFWFGSELKALLTQAPIDRSPDLDGLADYLRLGYIPREATAVRGVRRLLPGHILRVSPGGNTLRQWWCLEDADASVPTSDPAALRELADRFDDAVRLRMRSDVTVGAFLSGGLDSSLVSLAAAHTTDRPLQTYTVSFAGSRFDETPFARLVAAQGKTNHRELAASPADAMALLARVVWHLDEPVNDSAVLPAFLVSRLAAEDLKVCLSGIGGDELFGGYSRYADSGVGRIRRLFRSTPYLAGALAPAFTLPAPAWAEELRLAADPRLDWRGYLHQLEIFDAGAIARLGLRGRGTAESLIESLWARYPGTDQVGRRQFIDQHTYLPDQILALTDRMSMAVSLEVRTPFLDPRLVRFAAALPADQKHAEGNYKVFLKRSLGSRVPKPLLTRPKWGFDAPTADWLVQPGIQPLLRRLPQLLGDVLCGRAIRRYVQDEQAIRQHARHVWGLLTLAVWLHSYGASAAPDGPIDGVLHHA